ncbi:MAG: hypothetical protein ABI400_13695 [Lacisediminihabitans sp.]
MDATALPDLVRYQDLGPLGLSRHRFDLLLKAGEYARIAPGMFLRADSIDDTTVAWIAIAAKKPDATLCLLSALALHDLTDEIPRSSDIAIPRGTHPMKVNYSPITWHRFAEDSFAIGRTEHALPGGQSIGLYSPARTIIDLFRLRHEWGSDIGIDALKRWLRERGNSPSTLLAMAGHFPDSQPALQSALEILL